MPRNRPTQARCCSQSCFAQPADLHRCLANSLVCSHSRIRGALMSTIAQARPCTRLLLVMARFARRHRRRFAPTTTRSNRRRRRRRRRNGCWVRRRDGRTSRMHVSSSSAAVVGCCCRLLSSLIPAALLFLAASVGSRRLQLRRPCCRGGEIERPTLERPALSGLLVYRPSRRAEIVRIEPDERRIRA